MDPEQSPGNSSGSQYDFIVNPGQVPKPKRVPGIPGGANPFIVKIVFLVGSAVFLMIVVSIMVNIFFGNKTNLGDIEAIAQTETEMIRVSGLGSRASDQKVRNAAVNTNMTLITQRQQWLTFLQRNGKKLNDKTLGLKKDAATDVQLNAARQTSTFDTVLTQLMRTQLQAYTSSLQDAYNNATSKQEKALLQAHFSQAELLLKQWPT